MNKAFNWKLKKSFLRKNSNISRVSLRKEWPEKWEINTKKGYDRRLRLSSLAMGSHADCLEEEWYRNCAIR